MPTTQISTSPLLSIIIPARNEALRLPVSLNKIACYLAKTGHSAEIIVVDNLSTDGTGEIVREFARQCKWLRVKLVVEPHLGKGAAVRTGMLCGTGEILFLCDADLSMPIEELDKFLTSLSTSGDIAVGCREGVGAERNGEPMFRYLMGRLFNGIVRTMGLTNLPDTQCGFKAFRSNAARDLFTAQTISGWGFDVEILLIARLRRYSISSIPIKWEHDLDSRVSPIRDGFKMLFEIIGIYERMWLGLYSRNSRTNALPDNVARPQRKFAVAATTTHAVSTQ